MTLRLLGNLISAVKKTFEFCHYVRNVVMDVITFPVNLYKPLVVLSILLHIVISLPDAASYDNLIVFLLSCMVQHLSVCSMSLPHCAMGWSVIVKFPEDPFFSLF